ncbi:MAG: SDR family oxidoreductase [Bacillus sp. (in: Bacteria)]|nr:SDR family oxidoreductase [Bacillus sp. (in: firmicutes)]
MLEKKKTVVITGGGSGFGAALSKNMFNKGFHVCLLGRDEENLEKTGKSMSGKGTVSSHVVDVTSYSSVESCFNSIFLEHGKIDILINNAGMARFGALETLAVDTIDHMLDTNLKGAIYCTKAFLELMKRENDGIILNVVSTAGLVGKKNETVYCASKFGLGDLRKVCGWN